MRFSVIGCDGSYPGANGACSGYLVEAGQDALQLDLGCGVLPRLMARKDPADLGAVLITHWHNDHASDMLTLKYYLLLTNRCLRVLAPPQPHPLRELLQGNEFHFEDITKPVVIAGFSITAVPVIHPIPAYAVRIARDGHSLVYTGDAAGGESLEAFCRGADLLICDAAFTKSQWKEGLPHFSAAQAAALARRAGVRRLVLTHGQPSADHALLTQEAKEEFPDSIPAKPDLIIQL
jgi:ribonuclease BN (tRNA processing enzyme)